MAGYRTAIPTAMRRRDLNARVHSNGHVTFTFDLDAKADKNGLATDASNTIRGEANVMSLSHGPDTAPSVDGYLRAQNKENVLAQPGKNMLMDFVGLSMAILVRHGHRRCSSRLQCR